MLKLKDNVDLKELKKYGFKAKYNVDTGEIEKIYSLEKSKKYNGYLTDSLQLIFVKDKKNRFVLDDIFEGTFRKDIFFTDVDLLYDLIKDGIVEKIK